VEDIEAPLLLMHGDLGYISIAQSEAMFMAFKRLGKHTLWPTDKAGAGCAMA